MAGRVLRDSKGRFKGSTKGWGKGKSKTGGRKKGQTNLQKRGAFRERVSANRRVVNALTKHGAKVAGAATTGYVLGGGTSRKRALAGALIGGSLAHVAYYDDTAKQVKYARKNTRGVIS